MKKDLIFFGENGLTSTSANHVANLAKEFIQSKQTALDNVCFYKTQVGLISSAETKTIKDGNSNEELEQIPSMLMNIAQAKSLIAWLREAIKARETITKELNSFTLANYCKMKDIEYPSEPIRGHVLTEDEYFGSLGIKERNRYYQLETQAAVIGKYIHPDGVYADAREDMKKKSHAPHSVSGTGRDALIYTYDITVDPELVESKFFELQNKHREIQSQLNSIKFECQKAIDESETKVNAEYEAAYKEYLAKLGIVNAEFVSYKKKQSVEIGKLKIVIPDSLKVIYTEIATLGK